MQALCQTARARGTWCIAALIFCGLLAWSIHRTYPPFLPELSTTIVFPTGAADRKEPIVATGTVGKGDVLQITYHGADTATFVYETAGQSASSLTFKYVPGSPIAMRLEMPSVVNAGQAGLARKGTLRVRLDGTDVLRFEVPYHPCSRTRVFIGENPVHGATLGNVFRGKILTPAGNELRGRPDALFPFRVKLVHWLKTRWWHFVPLLLAAFATTVLARTWSESHVRRHAAESGWLRGMLTLHGAFVAGVLFNLFVFTWLMTGGKFRLAYPDAFGAYYDIQAMSFLKGHLDVPAGTLGGEAFMVGGKEYGYFGPTPALLRIPMVLANVGIGHMTRSFLILEYLACLVAAYVLLQYITKRLRGPGSRPSSWAILLMLVAAGGGSTLLFLGSRAYVYHEAILCGVAFALWSGYFSLRYLESPRPRWWITALVTGVLAVQARPPVGLFALCLLGSIAAYHVIVSWRLGRSWRVPFCVGALAVCGLLTLQGLAYLKFRTFDGSPLRLNVQYTPERLARIEGRIFHRANIRHNLDAYFLRPAFSAGKRFPFLIFDLTKRDFPAAKMDLRENLVGMLYSMAGLVALALVAVVGALHHQRARSPLLLLFLASLPTTACLLTFIATSHRYTADFAPSLIIAAAFGLAICDRHTGARRKFVLGTATALSLFALALTIGISFHFQVDLVWGVPEEVRNNFLELRAHFDRWFDVT